MVMSYEYMWHFCHCEENEVYQRWENRAHGIDHIPYPLSPCHYILPAAPDPGFGKGGGGGGVLSVLGPLRKAEGGGGGGVQSASGPIRKVGGGGGGCLPYDDLYLGLCARA